MRLLSDLAVRSSCIDRAATLRPTLAARWGRMSAHQMVCHLNDSFEAAAGIRHASPASGIFQRTVMKWGALRLPIPWPKGVPTRPEIEQGRGGTPPTVWETDSAALGQWINRFPTREKFAHHPVFGALTYEEWMIWGFRHVDHHLRQFGV
jgi:hypothetical protein